MSKRGQSRRKRNAQAEAAADRARAEAQRRRHATVVPLPPLRDNVSAEGDDGRRPSSEDRRTS